MEQQSHKNTINSAKELAELIKKNQLVIIKFSARWCGPCKDKLFLESYSKLKNRYQNDKIKFIELDVDLDSKIINDQTYYEINIDSIPFFMVCHKGNFINEFKGGGCLSSIEEIINKV